MWKRRKQLLDDLKEIRHCSFKVEALDRSVWGSRFGRGSEPVVSPLNEGILVAPADILFIFYPILLSY
jgi:hypothetical protein